MKKNIIKLTAAEAFILAAAVILTASAVKKTLNAKGGEGKNNIRNTRDTSIAAVSDAILESPAAEYVFGEINTGTDIV